MAATLSGDPSHLGTTGNSPFRSLRDKSKEFNCFGSGWYFSRKEIEENSPSRRDGIDLKKETYLRKSYCTFLQDLGMRLKVPQVTIATAIVFCHRFFLRQSHAKNDRRTIATVCMFLAGKVEETPRPLKDVILVSYESIHKKDPAAAQKIKLREVYEQQKELILLGERVVLATLGFDLNVNHPYKPLVEAIKKFNVAQNALAQVAWNFVNDGLRASLCLQFMPHHIAAGAIFLAAKFLKVKLPSDGEKVWWQEFDVTPRQLEEVSNQMLELYEQNRAAASSHANENEGSVTDGANQKGASKASPVEDQAVQNGHSHAAGTMSNHQNTTTSLSTGVLPDQQQTGSLPVRSVQMDRSETMGKESKPSNTIIKAEADFRDRGHTEFGNAVESSSSRHVSGHHPKESGPPAGNTEIKGKNPVHSEAPKSYTPNDAIKMLEDRVKAALEKKKKTRGEVPRKVDVMDEDDLIERELESGVELAVEDEKVKQEKKQSGSKPSTKQAPLSFDHAGNKNHESCKANNKNMEEGEFSSETSEYRSPDHISRKRKAGREGYPNSSKYQESLDESHSMGFPDRSDHKRHRLENQV